MDILRWNYLRNKKYFLYFFAFCKLRFNIEQFQTKKRLIADVFFNLRTPRDGVR